jgi:hypothetical protein
LDQSSAEMQNMESREENMRTKTPNQQVGLDKLIGPIETESNIQNGTKKL